MRLPGLKGPTHDRYAWNREQRGGDRNEKNPAHNEKGRAQEARPTSLHSHILTFSDSYI